MGITCEAVSWTRLGDAARMIRRVVRGHWLNLPLTAIGSAIAGTVPNITFLRFSRTLYNTHSSSTEYSVDFADFPLVPLSRNLRAWPIRNATVDPRRSTPRAHIRGWHNLDKTRGGETDGQPHEWSEDRIREGLFDAAEA
ncbi:hypothetical protein BO70DRAFT_114368 [Aspergillus heteromorphus CBS 117.55]|uniref:Uncharacterized protein n=1 Tax=Aspergillus heteromorphus CBS 117.55 TaxID=1448321 RepID=A0A317VJJ4_9EURO|nr:uncharacterized protein BO70DRAFT_114368 [Aspergillus heteromorphus CBS 117.55]PWY73022.1 hypothetical protein BO70DRAFT_114368 [Aspergillus heteromorphus CBS 117.55]